MTAARRPESQEQILEAAVASLTEADIPPDEQDGWLDPDVDPPAELAALPDAELEELLAAVPPRPAPPAWPLSYRHPDGPGGAPWPAGSGSRDSVNGSAGFGNSAGFASGGTGFASGGAGFGESAGFASGGAGFASGGAGFGESAGFASSGAGFASGDAGFGTADGRQRSAGYASQGSGVPEVPRPRKSRWTGAGGGPWRTAAVARRGADDAHARLAALTDDELIGVLRAWRRQACWAQARELAAVAELARRRPAEGTPPAAAPGGFPAAISEFTADEVAMALTLTGRAAGAELDLALDWPRRPATAAALETGQIDLPRAKILVSLLGPLAPAHAAAVEARDPAPGRADDHRTAACRAGPGGARSGPGRSPAASRGRRAGGPGRALGRPGGHGQPGRPRPAPGRGPDREQSADPDRRRLEEVRRAGWDDLLRAHAYLALLNGQPVDTAAGLLPPVLVPGHPGPVSGPGAGRGGRADASAPGPDGAPAARRAGPRARPGGRRPAGAAGRAARPRPRRPAANRRVDQPHRPADHPARPGPRAR